MDNLVLTRLALELASKVQGAVLDELRQESSERFRLVFAPFSEWSTLLVSLRSELPWIGRPAFRWEGPRWSPDAFAVAASRSLRGRRVERIVKQPPDRALRIDFSEGHALVIELATHGANLVLLSPEGLIETIARRPKVAGGRLEPGRSWEPRALPQGKLDPFSATADELDAFLGNGVRAGGSLLELLRRDVVGIGSIGAELVLRDAGTSAATPGAVLRRRLDALLRAETEVVIEGPIDPRQAEHDGTFQTPRFRLLPWRPSVPTGAVVVFETGTSATVGFFYDAVERVERVRGRIVGLAGILRGELRRTVDAGRKVQDGLRSFENPQRHQRMGEALLAGLSSARRSLDSVLVPDPYDPEGKDIAIPAPHGRALAQVASELFQRGRRARRGLEAASLRAQTLSKRAARLADLLAMADRALTAAEADALEAAMREEKLAVGLTRPTRVGRAAARVLLPKLEGVRMITSADGWTILVGRTGSDNDRLTFKIAAPDDIWLHAAGVPGAHVVVRNPDRRTSIPDGTLAEAARIAAWFSDSRSEGMVDVQWTRRKNVKRARGGPAGRVVLKRSETLRVRASRPPDAE